MATISKDVIQCCTCFKSPRYSQSLTDQIGNSSNRKSYGEILHHLLKLNSHYEGDCYLISQQICNKCAGVLKSVYAFIVTALREYKNHFEKMCEGDCLKEESIDLPLLPPGGVQVKIESKYSESLCDGSENEKLQSDCNVRPKDNSSNDKIELCKEETKNSNCRLKNNSKRTDDDGCLREERGLFPENEIFNEHFSKPPNNLPRRCDICDKVYNNARALRIHRTYTHMPDEKKMPCPLCSFKSSRKYSLKVHLCAVHGQDYASKFIKTRKYRNNLQNYINRGSLNDTRLREKFEKPVKQKRDIEGDNIHLCTFCGKSFTSKYSLVKHVRLHTGEKPYKCDLCPKTFTRKDEMKLHRVIHSDEKPHQCTQCSKSFKRSDKLRVHMRVHSQLRPYKCPECEKTFKYSNVMRTHMHIHTGQRPFECATCGEAFSLRTSLNIHCTKNNHVKLKSSSNQEIE